MRIGDDFVYDVIIQTKEKIKQWLQSESEV